MKKNGFTLIEILGVITLLALLSVIILMSMFFGQIIATETPVNFLAPEFFLTLVKYSEYLFPHSHYVKVKTNH